MVEREQVIATFVIALLIVSAFWISAPYVAGVLSDGSRWKATVGEDQEWPTVESVYNDSKLDWPIIPSVMASVEGDSWDLLWDKLKTLSMWDLEYYDGGWQSRKDLLTVIKDFPEPNVCKITLDFTSDQAGNYRLTFVINRVVKNYVEKVSNWQYNLTYEDFSIVFDWSDAKDISGLQFSHGIKDNFFWFRMRRDNVPANYNVVIDPSVIGTSLAQGAVGYPYQRKSFWALGLHWVFYPDTVYFEGMVDNATKYATSPDGITWTLHNSFAVYHAASAHYSIFYNGSHVVVARHTADTVVEGGSQPMLSWRQGIPNADGTITWDDEWQAVRIGDATSYDLNVHVIIDDEGYSWIGTWNRVATSYYLTVYKNSELDGTWTNAGGFPANIKSTSDTPAEYVCLVPLTDGMVYALMGKTGETTKGKLWNVSWSGQETVSGGNMYRGHSMSGVGDDNETVHFVYYKTDNTIRYRSRAILVGWGTEVTIETVVGQDASPCISLYQADDYLYVFYYENDPSGVYYVEYTTSWQAKVSIVDESIYQYYLTCFHKMYGGMIGVAWTKSGGSPYDVKYAFVFDPPCRPEDFYIENMSADNWLFSEYRYYIFNARYSRDEGTAALNVANIYFLDASDNNCSVYFDFTDNSSGIATGGDFIDLGRSSLIVNETIAEVHYVNVTFPIYIKINIVDKLYVDFYLEVNNIYGVSSGWENTANNYAHIYRHGGLSYDTFSGQAGRIRSGDIFDFWAQNASLYRSDTYWRNLQHVRIRQRFAIPAAAGEYGGIWHYYGMAFYAHDEWIDGFYVRFTWTTARSTSNYQYVNFTAEWYHIVGSNQHVWLKTDFNIFAFNNEGFNATEPGYDLWIDLWFNRINASSIFGGRIGAYEWAQENTANPWWRWTGDAWGIMGTKAHDTQCYGTLWDNDNDTVYAQEIELTKLWSMIEYPISSELTWTGNQTNVGEFELGFAFDTMVGIQTPAFNEPKIPVVTMTSYTAFFKFNPLASFLSPFVSIGGLVARAFNGFINAAIDLMDGAIFFITGQSGAIRGFADSLGGLISAFISLVAIIPITVGNMIIVLLQSVSWFWGANSPSLFDSIWGIFGFVFNPALYVFGWLRDIIGVSVAWLAGTTYTNGGGQVFDFTMLSGISVLGVSGGAGMIALLVFIGFPIWLVMAFLDVIRTGSLAPLITPIHIVWGLLKAMIYIAQLVYPYIMRMVAWIVQFVHTVRQSLPKIFGTG